jgi:1D-myo-inositol 3-kinase
MSVPDLLVVGHVTCDEIAGTTRLGGSAAFAARAAALLGVRTALVTAAPLGHPLLGELRTTPGLDLGCHASPDITTFAIDYEGPHRRLRLRKRATPLTPEDLPQEWRDVKTAYIGPVGGECDRQVVYALAGAFVGVGLQGWLRRVAPDGLVEPALSDEIARPPSAIRVAILSELDHAESQHIAETLAGTNMVVALTRGAAGALILHGEQRLRIPAAPADEVDPTGAGDVFGVILTVALSRGIPLVPAANLAAQAAARVVEGPGLGRLATLDPTTFWPAPSPRPAPPR